jgi:hypothetical protein
MIGNRVEFQFFNSVIKVFRLLVVPVCDFTNAQFDLICGDGSVKVTILYDLFERALQR